MPRTPVPARLPRVVWRAGLDLKPVDLSDPGEVGWLEALVWPEQVDRLARLRAAIKIASQPPKHHAPSHVGLDRVWAQAQEAGVPVVFHVGGELPMFGLPAKHSITPAARQPETFAAVVVSASCFL